MRCTYAAKILSCVEAAVHSPGSRCLSPLSTTVNKTQQSNHDNGRRKGSCTELSTHAGKERGLDSSRSFTLNCILKPGSMFAVPVHRGFLHTCSVLTKAPPHALQPQILPRTRAVGDKKERASQDRTRRLAGSFKDRVSASFSSLPKKNENSAIQWLGCWRRIEAARAP